MYNKLFTKILDSSIWMEPTPTRIVWLTLIAAMDETGFVQFASIHNVAHRAVVTLEQAQEAVNCLEATDANSSDGDNEGRRIERVSGGWIVLNAHKYRAIATREHQKLLNRERVKKYRTAHKSNGDVMHPNETVTLSEAEADTEKKKTQASPAFLLPEAFSGNQDLVKAWAEFQARYKKKTRVAMTEGTRDRHFKKLESWGEGMFLAALNKSIDNNYTDIFEPKANILASTHRPANTESDHKNGF